MPRQIPLDLGHRAARGREDFLVSSSNREAVAWIDRWPDWPRGVAGISIRGPEGCGKTHLGAVWQEMSGAAVIPPSDLGTENLRDMIGDAKSALIDDFSEQINFRAAFHLHNLVVERGGNLLILSISSPSRLNIGLPDLRSRLNAMPSVEIGAPDDGLLFGLLDKLFADRQLPVGEEVIDWIVPRMNRSFAAARDIVDAVDKASMAEKRRVTLPLVRELFPDIAGNTE